MLIFAGKNSDKLSDFLQHHQETSHNLSNTYYLLLLARILLLYDVLSNMNENRVYFGPHMYYTVKIIAIEINSKIPV